ncbi:MAG: glycosyl hydrolase family 8 [Minisyncoccales bacterium]
MADKSVINKIMFLVVIVLFWILFGLIIKLLVGMGYLSPLPPSYHNIDFEDNFSVGEEMQRTRIAEEFVYDKLVEENGHLNLYYLNSSLSPEDYEIQAPYRTNSEAASYYLLWNTNVRNKVEFDRELEYMEENMLREDYDYLMWRLEENSTPIEDGSNIASDADLRAILALYHAKEIWGDEKYSEMINKLSSGLENIAVSDDDYFVPYGGVRNNEVWKADVVWLSYSNFQAFRKLAMERGNPWIDVYNNMKKSVLESQLENGLFNPVINNKGEYINTLEEGYSINSMWVMVRAAESGDKDLQEAARKSLEFYKSKYETEGYIAGAYDEEGNELSGETLWAYALIGRTAVALGDAEFSKEIVTKILERQNTNPESEFYGSFPEGESTYVSQFTLQEIILTLQEYTERSLEKKEGQ